MSIQNEWEADPSRPISVDYDSRCPSPYFTSENIAYIKSIDRYLEKIEIEKVGRVERFVYNSIFGFFGVEVCGLRPNPRRDHIYVRRFGALPYIGMMEKFTYKAYEYLDEDSQGRCNFPSQRLACSDGKNFYPLSYHGNRAQWERAIGIAAQELDVELARFDECRLTTSTGSTYRIADMEIEMVQADEIPDTW